MRLGVLVFPAQVNRQDFHRSKINNYVILYHILISYLPSTRLWMLGHILKFL